MEFDLWLETEHVEGAIDDVCNVLVTLASRGKYALNVSTFAFFEGLAAKAIRLRRPPGAELRPLPR